MKELRQFTMGTGYRNTGFYVRGTGHFIIEHQELDKFADYCEIFWCIGGSARFYDGGQEFLYRAIPSRYEKRSGVLMPTIISTTIGEDRNDVILLKEFELNVTFSDDVFQVPEDKIKIGRKSSN